MNRVIIGPIWIIVELFLRLQMNLLPSPSHHLLAIHDISFSRTLSSVLPHSDRPPLYSARSRNLSRQSPRWTRKNALDSFRALSEMHRKEASLAATTQEASSVV